MAWIESHQQLARHPKMIRLSVLLKIPKAQAIGHLHLLWWWTLDFAPSGDLSAFSSCEICGAAEWTGSSEGFVKAIKETGWIEESGKIHDWDEYTLHLDANRALAEIKRDQTRERVRAFREKNRKVVTICNADVTQSNAHTIPTIPTIPNPTKEPDWTSILPFKSDLFIETWRKWVKHRSEIKKTLTPTQMRNQLDEMKSWGESESIKRMEQSISQGWQGLFEIKASQRGQMAQIKKQEVIGAKML